MAVFHRQSEIGRRVAKENRQEIHDLESFLPGGLHHLKMQVAVRIAGPPVLRQDAEDDDQDPRCGRGRARWKGRMTWKPARASPSNYSAG